MIPWFSERDIGKTLRGKRRERNGEEAKTIEKNSNAMKVEGESENSVGCGGGGLRGLSFF